MQVQAMLASLQHCVRQTFVHWYAGKSQREWLFLTEQAHELSDAIGCLVVASAVHVVFKAVECRAQVGQAWLSGSRLNIVIIIANVSGRLLKWSLMCMRRHSCGASSPYASECLAELRQNGLVWG